MIFILLGFENFDFEQLELCLLLLENFINESKKRYNKISNITLKIPNIRNEILYLVFSCRSKPIKNWY